MNSKRKYFFFIILLLFFIPIYYLYGDNNKWISHISYSGNIDEIVQNGNYVYALTDGKLFIYNQSDEELSEYIKSDGGNYSITHIAYNKKNKCLVITRSDYNIELLYENQSYVSISGLKNHPDFSLSDRAVNQIFMSGDSAYLATNYGYSIVDISRREIKESGMFHIRFYSISESDDNKLYAATETGIRIADLDKQNNNLQDITNWKEFPVSKYYKDEDYTFVDTDIKKVVSFKGKLFFLYPDSAVYMMDDLESLKGVMKGLKPSQMYLTSNSKLILLNNSKFVEFDDLSSQASYAVNSLLYVIPNVGKSNQYWLSSSGFNLWLGEKNDFRIDLKKGFLAPQGPASNYPFSQSMQNNQLIVTGGGYYTAPYDNPASLSIYKDREWSNIIQDSIIKQSGVYAEDFGYAISDPSNSENIYASSWGQGLYSFLQGRFIGLYNSTHSTSSLQELVTADGYRTTRVGGMAYDKSGTLWLLNSGVKNTIQTYQRKKDLFTAYDFEDINGTSGDTNTKCIFIDRYSNKWVGTFAGNNYLFILNAANTTHKVIFSGGFKDQNNNNLDITDINDIAEDINGSIWVATNIGPYYISNSSTITSRQSLTFYKVKVDKGTGSGLVTGLLEEAYINAIKVDGANRKWIGTQKSGVFLLSSDNSEILEHFTIDNSPLPSDNVISLSIDPKNGYVYIGTDKGLMAYRSEVTEGAENLSNVYVYPNPVRPEYSGVITISGLELDTNIKITDVKGNLIVEGKSLGGQFVWDGLSAKGRKVDTGVYLVFAYTEDGSRSAVAKFMVIR